MADFKIAYAITAKVEGGYANNPHDAGGETYKGIARKMHPTWKGWAIIDAIKRKVGTSALSIDKAAEQDPVLQGLVLSFYKDNYWNTMSLDSLNDQKMANELYDTGVNMGLSVSGKFFQRVLNISSKTGLTVDGKIGPKTVGLFNQLKDSDKYMVWKFFNCLQGEKYISICEARPSQEIFLRSWASRVFENN
jgi:lysozyme family protein